MEKEKADLLIRQRELMKRSIVDERLTIGGVDVLLKDLQDTEDKLKEFENKERNEGICKCGHHSKDHSYSLSPKCDDLECDKCDCRNYEFKEFENGS